MKEMFAYKFLVASCGFFYRVFRPAKVHGSENIPQEGGFVLVANHQHWLDPVHIAAHLPQRQYHYMAKAETFCNGFMKWLMGETGVGAIPVNRGQSDLNAIRMSMKVIADGHALAIFPQGHRSRDNSPTPFLNGASMIALRAGAPIIPVFLDGPYRLLRRADVYVGKPIDISDLGRKFDADTLNEITRRMESAVWSMKQ